MNPFGGSSGVSKLSIRLQRWTGTNGAVSTYFLLLALLGFTSAVQHPAFSQTFFEERFVGAPSAPLPWSSPRWDIVLHDRTDGALNAMEADHDAMCGAPPSTHSIHSNSEAVFLCRDHVMTAVNSSDPGYAAVYLTPAALVDWADGVATISFDVSTFRSTNRDWIDLWITPWEDNMVLPLEAWLPDLNGPPRRAIHLRVVNKFAWAIYAYPGERKLSQSDWRDLPVPYSKTQRDTFSVMIGAGRLKLLYRNKSREGSITVEDIPLPHDFNVARAVMQFGHHSYTPAKDCPATKIGACGPNTWHWGNVKVDKAKEFQIAKIGRLSAASTIGVSAGWLRFAARGATELNWGEGWIEAHPGNGGLAKEGQFASYFVQVPMGATSVQIKGRATWAGPWRAEDVSVWSLPPTLH